MSRKDEGYARLSNGFWRSTKGRKLAKLNPSAGFLYIRAISFASDNMTDGHLTEDDVLYNLDANQTDIDFLVDNHYWDPSEDGDGWQIHDYLDMQNSREQIEQARNKDRRRKQAAKQNNQPKPDTNPNGTQPESNRNPHGIQPEAARNVKTENQNQNQNTLSPNVERETAHATTESELIDIWEPTDACTGIAAELERQGLPHVDIQALAITFRLKLHAKGLKHYGYKPTLESLDYAFFEWIRSEARQFAAKQATDTKTEATGGAGGMPAKPHRHTYACNHVLDLLGRDQCEAQPDVAACALADRLNQGETGDLALKHLNPTRKHEKETS